MEIEFLGATGTVTGSKYLVTALHPELLVAASVGGARGNAVACAPPIFC